MKQNFNFENILQQIKSGKRSLRISKNFANCQDSNRLVETIINGIENKNSRLRYLAFGNIKMCFSTDAIKLLTSFLKTNKTIEILVLDMSYENTEQAFKHIGNMFKENKTISDFSLHCEDPITHKKNADKYIKYLTDGLKRSNVSRLDFSNLGLKTNGSIEVSKLMKNPNTKLTEINIRDNCISKNVFERILIPAMRINVSLFSLHSFDISGNLQDSDEEYVEGIILSENRLNNLIKWCLYKYVQETYHTEKGGFITKQQQDYLKGKPVKNKVKNFNASTLPFQLRLYIQEYNKDLKSNIDNLIQWIEQHPNFSTIGIPAVKRAIINKLRRYKINLQDGH